MSLIDKAVNNNLMTFIARGAMTLTVVMVPILFAYFGAAAEERSALDRRIIVLETEFRNMNLKLSGLDTKLDTLDARTITILTELRSDQRQ